MGKVIRYTGSSLLGEELRRLRGSRTLDDIVRLSKEGPLTSRVQLVSAPTLSQIENGITMPGPEVLYSLSVIYSVSPVHLLHLVVEDKLTRERADLPQTREEARERLQQEFERGNWHEAMALATRGARLSKDENDRVLWEASRAMAMRRLGMRQDALSVLIASAEVQGLSPAGRHLVHSFLAEAALEAGYLDLAAFQAERARLTLPEDALPITRLRATLLGVQCVISGHAFEREQSEPAVRQAQRELTAAKQLNGLHGLGHDVQLAMQDAQLTEILGNMAIARREYEAIAASPESESNMLAIIAANLSLGRLHLRRQRHAQAEACFQRAESRAVLHAHSDEAFEAYFGLLQVALATNNGRAPYLTARCERYLPLVQARTPSVLAFERLAQVGAR